MDRDKQIELLQSAVARRRSHVASWIQDPGVQETLKKNREHAKRMKAGGQNPPRVKACG